MALALLAALSEQANIKLTSRTEESISLLPTIFAAVLLGPLAAMIVGAASMLGDLIPRGGVANQYQRWLVYTATRSITGGITGVIASSVMDGASGTGFKPFVLATLAAAIVANALDLLFAVVAHMIRGVGSPTALIATVTPMILASIMLSTPVLAVLAFAFAEVSPWTLPLFVVPAAAAQRSFTLYHRQRQLTDNLVIANERLERAGWSFASALVATLEARDQYTAGHSTAVAEYARLIAARMGLSDADQRLAHLAGLVHDIGKIGLPIGLLEKSGPLSLDERRQMEEHSAIGEKILANVEGYEDVARIVRHHHERVDGNGYPDRLDRDEIPVVARIVAVADAYDAMTSDRPYREAMPSRVARLRLAQAVESQFDTSVVAAFEALLAGAEHTRPAQVRYLAPEALPQVAVI